MIKLRGTWFHQSVYVHSLKTTDGWEVIAVRHKLSAAQAYWGLDTRGTWWKAVDERKWLHSNKRHMITEHEIAWLPGMSTVSLILIMCMSFGLTLAWTLAK